MDKREKILSSAMALFARDGLYRVSLRAVATHADCWLGSVSHFFPEKEQLYEAAVTEAARRCQADIVAAVAGPGTPEERLQRLCRRFLDGYILGEAHFILMDRANSELLETNFANVIQEQFDGVHAALAGIIYELVPVDDNVPLRWLVSYFLSTIYGAARLHRQHLHLLKLNDPQEMSWFLDGLVSYAMAGLITRALTI